LQTVNEKHVDRLRVLEHEKQKEDQFSKAIGRQEVVINKLERLLELSVESKARADEY